MKPSSSSMMTLVASVFVIAGAAFGACGVAAAQDRPPDVQEGVQVLTRGPVHEAFAETVSFNPEPGMIVSKAPPPMIEEVPPDQRPEGTNVAWIPGYWAWDDDRGDFLWVSGVWRAMPPGREWVSGYWGSTDRGSQWMSGYWSDARVGETIYLPEPPDSVEAGPNMLQPSPDQIWAPGCWVWHEGRYAWRPGYWVTVHPDWIWVPSHYVYSPRGYVYCEGYWDYPVASRGVMFAPVYFESGVYARSGFRYSPSIVISLSVFTNHLFVRPSSHHYYFGDYYDRRYYDEGIYASFSFTSSKYGYDPIFVNERYRHRDDRDWDHQVRRTFLDRREHVESRPPRTLAIQIALGTTVERDGDRSRAVAAPLTQVVQRRDQPIRFQPVAKEEKQELVKRGREVERFRGERRTLEAPSPARPVAERPSQPDSGKPSGGPGRPDMPDNAGKPTKPDNTPDRARPTFDRPDKAKLPRSPIVSRPADQQEKGKAPPSRPEPPKPDPKVEAKPKKVDGGRPEPPQAGPKDNRDDSPGKSKGNDKGDDKDKGKSKDKP